ncbi:uncharacterized protein LOC129743874 [Uranotaenia lowii]|uniref:uncharacterized protein LOC129743874 n=1 Tax=Uranotaenia lowii TaxID=190385 RepID=UPI0024796F58|nr:uncharacterized protein LOC129743874 [Uranotaenia lowii]
MTPIGCLLIIFAIDRCLALYKNTFEATLGCLQFNANVGYYEAHPYFSTAAFKNIVITPENVTVLRVGMLGRQDGHIRLAPVQYPYDNTKMHEFVISGWDNTRTEIRCYMRKDPKIRVENQILAAFSSHGLLSEFSPLMIQMHFYPGGEVKIFKDADSVPMVTFKDPKLSFAYMGFNSWVVPVIYFYDCPLEVDRRDCTGIVFS